MGVIYVGSWSPESSLRWAFSLSALQEAETETQKALRRVREKRERRDNPQAYKRSRAPEAYRPSKRSELPLHLTVPSAAKPKELRCNNPPIQTTNPLKLVLR